MPTSPSRSMPLRTNGAWRLAAVVAAVVGAMVVRPAAAQPAAAPSAAPSDDTARVLTAAIKPAPPFAVDDGDGTWSGLAVDLWNDVAARIGADVQWVAYDEVVEVMQSVEAGSADVAVGAITVTADRNRAVDFSYAFAPAELGIATSTTDASLWSVVRAIVTRPFLSAVGTLAFLIFAVGALMWLVERRRNTEQFAKHPVRGLGDGFWWSSVTMTTVGYGDKAPATFAGRVIGTIWMFASIVVISGLTGAIASALTVNQLSTTVAGVRDLPRATVGAIEGSAASSQLGERRIAHRSYPTMEAGLQAIVDGDVQCFVNDLAILSYGVQTMHTDGAADLTVLGETFGRGYYAFAMPKGSALRTEVNQALLEAIDDGLLDDLWQQYVATN